MDDITNKLVRITMLVLIILNVFMLDTVRKQGWQITKTKCELTNVKETHRHKIMKLENEIMLLQMWRLESESCIDWFNNMEEAVLLDHADTKTY